VVRVHLDLKPDRLAGTNVLRGVAEVGGVRIQSSTIVFPPSMAQSPPAIVPLAVQVDRLRRRLIEIVDQAAGENPVVLTLIKMRAKFTRGLNAGLYRAALIERERIKAHLTKNGFREAAIAIGALPLEDK
jgi:hypothetical protein